MTSWFLHGLLVGPFLFLAGGEGFEPPLAESESAVLPLDDPPSKEIDCLARLALRVLSGAACFSETDLFAFDFSRITSYETGFTQ